jgi:hypothetical protein
MKTSELAFLSSLAIIKQLTLFGGLEDYVLNDWTIGSFIGGINT